MATVEDASNVVIFPVDTARGVRRTTTERDTILQRRDAYEVYTDAGPRGLAFTENDQLHVYCFLDRTINSFSLETVHSYLEGDDIIHLAASADNTVQIAESNLSPAVDEGRRLFFSATDKRISIGTVSCASCHFEGRDDGMTWTFDRGLRQTPSLAGQISRRGPMRWDGTIPTVADDAMTTADELMRGEGLTFEEGQYIAAFIDTIRLVDTENRFAKNPQLARGEAIFNRADTACATCHTGPELTDGLVHSGVKTPSLLGIAATPPYGISGVSSTLERYLDFSKRFSNRLEDHEIEDLAAYLRAL